MLGSGAHAVCSSPNTAAIVDWLRTRALLDPRGYAMAPLRQRILRRMRSVACGSAEEYIDKLTSDPGEQTELLAELLGSRSVFGTDAGSWRAVALALASSRPARSALRRRFNAWSVGCATGEEAFTLAMMFAEAFGLEALGRRVEIVATDIDMRALEVARAAVYGAASIAPLPPSTITDYFDVRDGSFVVKEGLRRVVRFERHDVLRDEPLGGKHLVVCRDLAGALSARGRRRVTRRLARALSTGGLLVFGRGEWPEVGAQLEAVDAARGIYRRGNEQG